MEAKFAPYVHKVQYYETDMMGVVHHANYVRWMEEARVDFMDRAGFPYAAMEAQGVVSPVKSVACEYKRSCTFGDEIAISVSVAAFTGVVMTIEYDMRKLSTSEQVVSARSEHVFLDRSGRILRIKKVMPEFSAAMEALIRPKE